MTGLSPEAVIARRRLVRGIAIAVGSGLAALIVAAFVCGRVISSFTVQDVVFDNVPSKVHCDEVPSRQVAERAAAEFPAIDDADVLVVDRCGGAIIEVQYGDTTTRERIEDVLDETGHWDRESGWWWESVPVQLRNV
ncbi:MULTISPECIES: hypothetical protein [unclassified Brevibacterium]|uniref:hypothetical protein n=1 Tax=unclassified Brevibacterium TaxID=2614124 RepID=UPI0010F48973|nr:MULTISPECIES: hypothetical protein [unclassified Brevibacterium]MCM1011399.1 hypothetical protein [Brevibacterium sp. XM4083]